MFDPRDWLEIDPRAERFRPILSDEYADLALGELVGSLSLPTQQAAPHVMMKWSDRPTRMFTPLPLALAAGVPFLPRVAPPMRGSSHLPAKNDRYRTSRGVLGLDAYNAAARTFVPAACRGAANLACAVAEAFPDCLPGFGGEDSP